MFLIDFNSYSVIWVMHSDVQAVHTLVCLPLNLVTRWHYLNANCNQMS